MNGFVLRYLMVVLCGVALAACDAPLETAPVNRAVVRNDTIYAEKGEWVDLDELLDLDVEGVDAHPLAKVEIAGCDALWSHWCVKCLDSGVAVTLDIEVDANPTERTYILYCKHQQGGGA